MAYSSYHGNQRTSANQLQPLRSRSAAAESSSRGGSEIWEEIKEFDEFVREIDSHDQPALFSLGFSATRKWIPLRSSDACSNPSCNKSLGRLGWPNHCRRCKESFCKKCTNFERRLNRNGHPDPNGRLVKVCQKCYDQGPQPVGQTYGHTEFFKCRRRDAPSVESKKEMSPLTNCSNFMDKVNYDTECTRLKDGFMKSVGSSELRRTLVDFRSMVSKPEWQKSTFYIYNNVSPSSCAICSTNFVLTKSAKICCVCGGRVCRECSTKDLLVYVPDDAKDDPRAQLAIIQVIGCPEREPDLSLYLRICKKCCHVLREKQVHLFQSDPSVNKTSTEDKEFWASVTKISDDLRLIQVKVEDTLPKYQELIEALEVTKGSSQQVTSTNKSNMQVLAKAQGDLADYFTTLLLTLQRMKKILPTSSSQSVICKNISRSVYDFYQENRFIFNDLRRKLEGTTPLEVLEYIQDIVDQNVINSSYVTLKQFAFEVLHYTTKHELNESFVRKLLSAEDVVEKDLEQCVKRKNEDWSEHRVLVDQLLRDQLSERRIIHPSRSHTKAFGNIYVEMFLFERGEHVVREVSLQVTSKCAERSFKRTKEVLKVLLEDINRLHEERKKSLASREEDWVLL